MKKILVVIDMQNDFITGALQTKQAQKIVPHVIEKIKQYPKDCIYATRDTHYANYLETQEGELLPVVHCVENTEGWEFPKEIKEILQGAVIVNKQTFGSSSLADMLYFESIGQEKMEIELVGLCTDICVVANAILIKTRLPEAKVIVDARCCAGVTPESHKAALMTMKQCQCIIINEEEEA